MTSTLRLDACCSLSSALKSNPCKRPCRRSLRDTRTSIATTTLCSSKFFADYFGKRCAGKMSAPSRTVKRIPRVRRRQCVAGISRARRERTASRIWRRFTAVQPSETRTSRTTLPVSASSTRAIRNVIVDTKDSIKTLRSRFGCQPLPRLLRGDATIAARTSSPWP